MSSFSSIISQTYLDTTDKAILLRGNEYVHPLAITERWTKLRIGLLMSMTPDGTNSLLQGMLLVGLCSAGQSFFTSNTRFIGGTCGSYPSGTVGSTWTFNSAPPNSFHSIATQYVLSKVGDTMNPFTAVFTQRAPLLDANPRRGIFILDITKGSPNYTLQMFSPVLAHMSFSYGMRDLYNAVEQVNTAPVLNGTKFGNNTATGTPFSETPDNRLSSLNLYWNRWSFPVQISGIVVYQIY